MRSSKVVLQILSICVSLLVFVLVVFVLLKAGTMAYDMGYRIFTEPPMESAPGNDVVVEVDEGMSALSLGTMLEEKGLVEDAHVFMIQMKLSAYANKVRPGLYTLNTSQTAREMLQVMSTAPPEEEEVTE